LTPGFRIETELSAHALQLRMPLGEIPIEYREGPKGSAGKLSTYKDGLQVRRTIVCLIKKEKPFAFFSVVAGLLMLMPLDLGLPVVHEFSQTGLVPRLPADLLAGALAILGFLSFTCGFILDTVSCGRTESKRLAYLSTPAGFTSVRSMDPLDTER